MAQEWIHETFPNPSVQHCVSPNWGLIAEAWWMRDGNIFVAQFECEDVWWVLSRSNVPDIEAAVGRIGPFPDVDSAKAAFLVLGGQVEHPGCL